MSAESAKRIADKYIGRTGGAPAPSGRWKRPGRVGGSYLDDDDLRRVLALFDFLDVVASGGTAAYSRPTVCGQKGKLRERAAAARKSLAEIIGATEDDLRSTATIYLRQEGTR